jgi:hypothetical protein
MRSINNILILILGSVLVITGFIIPFLMVLQIIQASFLLSFLGFIASVSGLILGLIGITQYIRRDRYH